MLSEIISEIFPKLNDNLKEIESLYSKTIKSYNKNERLTLSNAFGKVIYNFDSKPMDIDDIKMFLVSWLNIIPFFRINDILYYNNQRWLPIYGFRRYSYIHNLFISESGEYAFHVFAENDPVYSFLQNNRDLKDYRWKPSFGVYSTFEELVNAVSQNYFESWNKKHINYIL